MARLIHRPRARLLAFAALSMLAIAVTACSGGNDSSRITPAEAQTIASEAVLVVGDLPDREWTVVDEQIGLESLVPGGAGNADFDILPAACAIFEDAISNLPAVLGDLSPLASASRSFTASGQQFNLDAVSTSVVVFEDAADAEQALAQIEDALSADNLEGCIQAASAPSGGDTGIQIVEFTVTRPAYALPDSAAVTARIDAIALILPINISLDVHSFQRDNVLAFYVGLGVNSTELETEHAGLLATFANRIEEARN